MWPAVLCGGVGGGWEELDVAVGVWLGDRERGQGCGPGGRGWGGWRWCVCVGEDMGGCLPTLHGNSLF